MMPLAFTWKLTLDLSFEWTTVSSITLPMLIGIAYFVRVGKLREEGRQPSIVRQASFACGMAMIVLVDGRPD